MNQGPEHPRRNILFLTSLRTRELGGSEMLWMQTAECLLKAGHRATVAVPSNFPFREQLRRLERAGAEIVRNDPFPLNLMSDPVRLFFFRTLPGRLFCPVKNKEGKSFDLAVLSRPVNTQGAEWAVLFGRLGIPWINIVQSATQGHGPHDWQRELLKKSYLGAGATYFVSRENFQETECQLAVKIPRAEVVCNPCNIPWEAGPVDWPEEKGVWKLAVVARLHTPSKGQDLLLRVLALPKWKNRPLEVSFIGTGEYGDSLRELAAHLGLQKVRFAGYVEDIAGVWKEHHGLVMPSRVEGLPLALVEAMRCGRPVIATRVGGNGEIIDDGQNGFLADFPSIESLDQAMERAWEQRYRWFEIGRTAHRSVRLTGIPNPAFSLAKLIMRPDGGEFSSGLQGGAALQTPDTEHPPWRDHRADLGHRPPTMLSEQEIQLLHYLAQHHYRGHGEIIDAGCFLGGSSHALACGLRDNAGRFYKEKRIHSYDRFIVEDWEANLSYITQYPELKGVRNFRKNYEGYLQELAEFVHLHPGDLMEARWNASPVEILFIDVAKTAALNDFIIHQFFPCLIPGHSVVVHQDYLWDDLPWIHISMEHFRDHFTRIDSLPWASNVYLCTKAIPAEVAQEFCYAQIPFTRKAEMLDEAIRGTIPEFRHRVARIKPKLYRYENQPLPPRNLGEALCDNLHGVFGPGRLDECDLLVGEVGETLGSVHRSLLLNTGEPELSEETARQLLAVTERLAGRDDKGDGGTLRPKDLVFDGITRALLEAHPRVPADQVPGLTVLFDRIRPGAGGFTGYLEAGLGTEAGNAALTEVMKHTKNFSEVTWLGQPVWQNLFDLWCIQEIITKTRPRWIIETGTNRGGSALFYASLFDLMDHGEVITIDLTKMERRAHPRITYFDGDSASEDMVRAVRERMGSDPGTVLVTLDSDHSKAHVAKELELYADLVSPGSYLIVQDTCIDTLEYLETLRPGPLPAVRDFLKTRDDFRICPEYNGKLLLSHHPSGYLRRRA